MSTEHSAALLELREPLSGAPFDGAKCSTQGNKVLLLGAWSGLFRLLSGRQRLSGGELLVMGRALGSGRLDLPLGMMRPDAQFPGAWKVVKVLSVAAQLRGDGKRQAARVARECLERTGWASLAGRSVEVLRDFERRLLSVLVASIHGRELLALEQPLVGLSPREQEQLWSVIQTVGEGRAWILSASDLSELGPVADSLPSLFDDVLVAGALGAAVRVGPSALTSASSYRVVLARQAEAFLARLPSERYPLVARQGETPTVVVLEDARREGLGPLLQASVSAGAPLLELTPLSIRIELS